MSHRHQRLSIVCVFCKEYTRFRRASDLKCHCEDEHWDKVKMVGPKFFSEKNCFWLAIHPQEYLRIYQNPSWDEELSAITRLEVATWVCGQREPSKTINDWKKGWESLHGEAKPIKRKRAELESPMSESRFVPDYTESTPKRVEVYSPEDPQFSPTEALKLVDISINRTCVLALLAGDNVYYEGKLVNILNCPQLMASLTRRMSTIKEMKMWVSAVLLTFALFAVNQADEDTEARLLASKSILNQYLVEGKHLTVEYKIYNIGGSAAFDVQLADDSFPEADFELVQGSAKVSWTQIPQNTNVTHAIILQPTKSSYFNFTAAQVSYLPTDAAKEKQFGYTSAPGEGAIVNRKEFERRFSPHVLDWLVFAVMTLPSLGIPFLLWFGSKKRYDIPKPKKNQ